MARFVISNRDAFHVILEGEDGEEISTEMVSAFAHLQAAYALESISDRLTELDTSLAGVADAIRG